MTADARLIRVPFAAGLVMLTPGEESLRMTLVAQQPLMPVGGQQIAESCLTGSPAHQPTPAHWPTHLPYTSKASLAGGFFGDVGLLRKIGNNEWNHHGQW